MVVAGDRQLKLEGSVPVSEAGDCLGEWGNPVFTGGLQMFS